jgi:hypothetical protein
VRLQVIDYADLHSFGEAQRIIPLTNFNFIISCSGGGFDESLKDFKPSDKPMRTYTN